jgi:hypothetical protein
MPGYRASVHIGAPPQDPVRSPAMMMMMTTRCSQFIRQSGHMRLLCFCEMEGNIQARTIRRAAVRWNDKHPASVISLCRQTAPPEVYEALEVARKALGVSSSLVPVEPIQRRVMAVGVVVTSLHRVVTV